MTVLGLSGQRSTSFFFDVRTSIFAFFSTVRTARTVLHSVRTNTSDVHWPGYFHVWASPCNRLHEEIYQVHSFNGYVRAVFPVKENMYGKLTDVKGVPRT